MESFSRSQPYADKKPPIRAEAKLLLSRRDAAQLLSISQHALDYLVARKKHPDFERQLEVIHDRKGRVIERIGMQEWMSKRLQWIRGHFSSDTQGALLFGKIVGRFWIRAQLSGLSSEGHRQ